MVYAVIGLAVLVLLESGGLAYLWSKWRSAQSGADVASVAANASAVALTTAYTDLGLARDALNKQNDLEAHVDAKAIQSAPSLDDAITRLNGVQ